MSQEGAQDVFQRIIRSVIDESRQDFEDCGVDEAALHELADLWRSRLAQAQRHKQQQADARADELAQKKGAAGAALDAGADAEAADGDTKTAKRAADLGDSDLDDLGLDSDEAGSGDDDDEDDDDEGDIILCLYERVQRVRNRWKCQLREGIATFNGRDYAFSKASGDSEW